MSSHPTEALTRPPLPKYQVLKLNLLQKINSGKWLGGERVPSESALIEEFDVSSTTARRCLDELAKEGFLYRVQGKGTFVSHIAHVYGKKSIGILCTGLASINHPFLRSLFGGIEGNIDAEKYIVEILPQTLFGDAPDPAKALKQLVEQRNLCGLFVISPMPEQWLEELLQSGFPLISIGIDYERLPIIKVLFDSESMLTASLEYLVGLGHKHITLFMGRFKEQVDFIRDGYTHACDAVERFLKRFPADAPAIDIIPYDWFDLPTTQNMVMAVLNKPRRATAYGVVEETVGRLVWDWAKNLDLRIPQDISIIEVWTHLSPYLRFTAMAGDIDNLTWRSVRIMEQLLDGEKPVRRAELIGGKLIAGESTGPAGVENVGSR